MRDETLVEATMPGPDLAQPNWSVIVPMRDESGNVADLVAEIVSVMSALSPFEIVAVDDGSVDGTAAELAAASLSTPQLRVITHATSLGQSQALITGALATHGATLVTIDGDGQNDPADIARLIAAYRSLGPASRQALTIGCRRNRSDGAMKIAASRLAALARRILLADPAPDAGCGLKVIGRETFLALPRFNALHRFMLALVVRAGGSVVSVSVGHRPRRNGRSKYGVVRRGLVGILDLLGVAWLIARYHRPAVK